MKTCIAILVMLIILLVSCTPAPLTPTQTNINAIRTQAVGTALFGLTKQAVLAAIDATETPVPFPNPCAPSKKQEYDFDKSNEGYFLGAMAISEYYTLLNVGLPEEAYKLLSPDAQKASPHHQYMAAQKKIKTIQIITVEPYAAWQQQQGSTLTIFDLANKIVFYVQVMVSGDDNPKGELQTLFLTLTLTEPEHVWKIDTLAQQYVAPSSSDGSIPLAFYSFSADRNYYDALVVVARYYTLVRYGFYEQAYPLYATSAPMPHPKSLEEYLDKMRSSEIKVKERVVSIDPIYKREWILHCATPDPMPQRLNFSIGIYDEVEQPKTKMAQDLLNGIHSYYLTMLWEHEEWKIYDLYTGSGPDW